MNDLSPIAPTIEWPARFSVHQFQRMIDAAIFEGSRVELVEGEIVKMSPALPRHAMIQRDIFRSLDAIFGNGFEGLIACFEHTVRFGPRTLRDIDVALVRSIETRDEYFGPAGVFLAIEVSSTTLRYDLNDKRIEYAVSGIPHYWVVDVPNERIHMMRAPLDGDYSERRPAAFGAALPIPGIDRTFTIR